MAKYKVVTPAGVTYAGPGAGYDYELERLGAALAERKAALKRTLTRAA